MILIYAVLLSDSWLIDPALEADQDGVSAPPNSISYPCQVHECACRSAEICLSHCCCTPASFHTADYSAASVQEVPSIASTPNRSIRSVAYLILTSASCNGSLEEEEWTRLIVLHTKQNHRFYTRKFFSLLTTRMRIPYPFFVDPPDKVPISLFCV